MPQTMSLQDMLYVLEATVLGAMIAYGYFARRRTPKVEAERLPFEFANLVPFELAYAVGKEIYAKPNSEVASGLFLFFNETNTARVTYQQLVDDTKEHANANLYVLRIAQRDMTGLEWLSMERRLEVPLQETTQRIRCEITARSNQPTRINVVCFLQGADSKQNRVDLGTYPVSETFEKIQVDVTLNTGEFEKIKDSSMVRFVILLEIQDNLCLDLKAWDIEVGSDA